MNRIPNKKILKKYQIIIIILIIIYLIKVNQYACKYFIMVSKQTSKDEEVRLIIKNKEQEIIELKNEIKNLKRNSSRLIMNRCVNEKIPKVSGILETAEYLRYQNKSLIRYGNGEIDLMLMRNIPTQYADQKLSEELIKAFNTDNPDIMVGIRNIFTGFPGERKQSVEFWIRDHPKFHNYMLKVCNTSKRYFDAFITSPYTSTYNTSCELVDLVYKELREVWRDKDLVILRGNNSQVYDFDVYDTARSQVILFCPRTNVWSKYEELKKLLLSQNPSSLYIISAGAVSEIFVMDLVKEHRRALDMGHLAKDYDRYMKKATYSKDFWVD